MHSRPLVDPQLLPLLELIPPFDLSAEILPILRNRSLPFFGNPKVKTAVASQKRIIPGPAGASDVVVHVYAPKGRDADLPCILHIHGGGYVTGSAVDLWDIDCFLAGHLTCVVVSVDYRLAPETIFPGAIYDCYAALKWVFANAPELAVDPGRIGVMGESAGGGLAAALALLTRDLGEYDLAFQHLIYPMLDDRTCTNPDPHRFAGEFIWTAQHNWFGWSSLLGAAPGGTAVSPYAAAARAQDLSRLPPAYIAAGALDLFLEEDLEYTRRLTRHGVPVELHVYPGAFHAFDLVPDAQVSANARRDSLAALRRVLHPAA